MTDETHSTKSHFINNFLDRFKGKTNRISKHGLNAILQGGTPDNAESSRSEIARSQSIASSQSLLPKHLAQLKPSQNSSSKSLGK